MAAVRRWYEYAEWIDYDDGPVYDSSSTFKVAGDLTARYVPRRRLWCKGALTLYGTVVSSTYDGSSTTTVTIDADSLFLDSSLSAVSVGIITPGANTSYKIDGDLGDLSDVATDAPSQGDVLTWSSASAQWAPAAIPVTAPSVPSGAQMLFYNVTAPTGWTQVTTNMTDRAVRVVAGFGQSAGGLNAFSDMFKERTLSVSLSIAGTAITASQMPPHAHNTGTLSISSAGSHSHTVTVTGERSATSTLAVSHTITISSAGAHTHTISTSHNITTVSGGSHNHGASGSFSGTATSVGNHSHGASSSFSGGSGSQADHTHNLSPNGYTAATGNHSHAGAYTNANSGSAGGSLPYGNGGGGPSGGFLYGLLSGSPSYYSLSHYHLINVGVVIPADGNHWHYLLGSTAAAGSHSHTISGTVTTSINAGGGHGHAVSGSVGVSVGSGGSHSHGISGGVSATSVSSGTHNHGGIKGSVFLTGGVSLTGATNATSGAAGTHSHILSGATSSVGSGGVHSHGGNAIPTPLDLNVLYLNMIMCSKD